MAEFLITAVRPDGHSVRMIYDNQTSDLRWENGKPVIEDAQEASFGTAIAISENAPGCKSAITTLKISMGLSCNYACTYCSQRFVPHAADAGIHDWQEFADRLPEWFDVRGTDGMGAGQRVEFWGGEPFVYWKTFKPLAERLRVDMPHAEFVVITNGSLLTPEIVEWLDIMDFRVGISHDGPGQAQRGLDPLENPATRAAILELYRRLQPKNRISINAMLTRKNHSRHDIAQYFKGVFGDDVNIGEGTFVDPYDRGGMASLPLPSEMLPIRRQALDEILNGDVRSFGVVRQKVFSFLDTLRKRKPAKAIWQKCGMDSPHTVATTLKGEALTCQNVSPISQALNGQPHKIGSVYDLPNVKLNTSTHWSSREECANCPVLHLCAGACMFLQGKHWEAACDTSFNDNIPIIAAAIVSLTGYLPVHIDGPQRETRKQLWVS